MDDVPARIDEHGELFEPCSRAAAGAFARGYGCDGGSFSGMRRG
jgi:hypothetical protein